MFTTHASQSQPEQTDDLRVPVTLLTGFLGAGKTTLLNQVLSDSSSGRIAVIVNEFGEAGLDHDLIETVDGDVMLMSSGCLCCSIRGDLSDSFVKLLAQRDEGMLSFDRVVIETTGLADPGPILQTLLVDSFLARNTRMDGVVTVVDAVNGPATLDAQFEAVSQVAMADLIVLSKTDLVSKASAKAVTDRLRDLNPTADILRRLDHEFALKKLWNLTSMREDAHQHEAISWTTPKVANDPLGNLSGLMATSVSKPVTTSEFSRHDTDISSVSIVLDEALDDAVFDKWFDTLIAYKGYDILRVKGILFLEGIETPFAFHGVQHIFDPPVPLKNWTGNDRRTRIVLIGRNLSQPEIQRSLDLLRKPEHADAMSVQAARGSD
ncbi:GTP-binding protein [Ruegeria sp. HKCCD4884]|uniref:CobW family GTP-binding protein n=1 Tax=Ruegeria sp. HKCCD4884 TaxID=2683022 RepID=UPI001491ED7D|nr:GTP-binding protein [Ruegeria sp. HKCCD4884]NOD94457.1 GTP-binding protein [Ruegeria sp. HKCCD4884]